MLMLYSGMAREDLRDIPGNWMRICKNTQEDFVFVGFLYELFQFKNYCQNVNFIIMN